MINLSQLNNLLRFIFLLLILIFNLNFAYAAVDIWEKKESDEQKNQSGNDNEEEEIISQIKEDKIPTLQPLLPSKDFDITTAL